MGQKYKTTIIHKNFIFKPSPLCEGFFVYLKNKT